MLKQQAVTHECEIVPNVTIK